MPGPGGREKLVILGGGAAAITAAFELSRPGWRERFESITVYQVGWRLGGKGASGRGRHGRIEEHGLHLWLGFYENAFRVMQDCYAELGRPPGAPLARWDDAFKKSSRVVLEDPHRGTWAHWPILYPEDDRVPGVPRSRRSAVRHGVLRQARARAPLEPGGLAAAVGRRAAARRICRVTTASARCASGSGARSGSWRIGRATPSTAPAWRRWSPRSRSPAASSPSPSITCRRVHDRLLRLLQSFIEWVRDRLARGVDVDDRVYRIGQLVEIVVASIRGIVRDERPHQGLRRPSTIASSSTGSGVTARPTTPSSRPS